MQVMGMRFAAALAVLVVAASVQADVTYFVKDDAHVQSSGAGFDINYVAVKRDENSASIYHRKGYVSYDLAGLADVLAARSGRLLDWQLDMYFVSSGLGSTSSSAMWDFQVYGLTDESLDSWDQTTINYANAPANDATDGNTVDGTKTVSVGTFSGAGYMIGELHSTSANAGFNNFIASDTNDIASFIVVRNTDSTGGNSYAHAFESANAAGTNSGAKLRLAETNNRIGTSGEFESSTGNFTTAGWSNNDTVAKAHDGIVAGSRQAARIDSTVSNALTIGGNADSQDFTVDYYFATADGGGSGNRGLAVNYRFNGDGQINLRVNGDGNIQVYNDQALGGSTGWKLLGDLSGIVQFSEDLAGDAGFDDVGDVLNVHRLKLVMHGSGTATPTYDIYLSDANATTFTAVALGLQYYQYGVPTTLGQTGLEELRFDGGLANADYVIDSVFIAIPEPATFAMFGLAAMTLIRRRR
ncbi:PEP-CTERM sorting domain-containing protein [Planctomycetales bacterium ZRK34]|nr:PEP-CTERM sorting domain-containing protein [Planctomycetales bacterium ZRK34]